MLSSIDTSLLVRENNLSTYHLLKEEVFLHDGSNNQTMQDILYPKNNPTYNDVPSQTNPGNAGHL